MGIYDQTTADNDGNFVFVNRFSPFSPREACITAQDQFGRNSAPTCLPPFPTRYNVTVGPVLMPATLSLDKNDYFLGDEIVLSGQTIPNSEVNLSMFAADTSLSKYLALTPIGSKSILKREIVKSAPAIKLPEYKTKSDDKGNFSISLPSSKTSDYRLFTQTAVGKDKSPKSIILNPSVLPWWMIIFKYFLFIWNIIRPRLLEIIIIIEIAATTYYIFTHYLHHKKIRTLMVREKHEIQITKSKCQMTNIK
ncbi:MAG: hypothetical protein HYW86_05515 [Candidatus Roizmanbacteria bacterium]|nr:MAG: hypothetical protein HYW86_05515 [Candidatus Roizmanbacteria bacterium]